MMVDDRVREVVGRGELASTMIFQHSTLKALIHHILGMPSDFVDSVPYLESSVQLSLLALQYRAKSRQCPP